MVIKRKIRLRGMYVPDVSPPKDYCCQYRQRMISARDSINHMDDFCSLLLIYSNCSFLTKLRLIKIK